MSEPLILVTIIAFIAFVPVMFLALNRGRLTRLSSLIYFLYAVCVAAPVFLKGLLQKAFPTLVYLLIVAALLLPELISELLNAARGRRPALRFIALVIGIVSLIMAPLFDMLVMACMVLLGLIALVLFFVQQYRYAGLNSMYIESLAKEAAEAAGSGSKWSSKPVTVWRGAGRQYWVAAPGLRAALKKDRSIIWMSRSYHKKLGEPNLEEFSKAFIERILRHE